jgi:hypothetical protein
MMRSLGLLLSFGLLVTSTAVAQECFPECRDGYLCHEGQCIESCNPPCKDGKVCTKGGQCAPDVATAPTCFTILSGQEDQGGCRVIPPARPDCFSASARPTSSRLAP